MSLNWTPLPWGEAQRRRRTFEVEALEHDYHQAANRYERFKEHPGLVNENAMNEAVTRYLETANNLKQLYLRLPWNLFRIRYLFAILRIHFFMLVLGILTSNGILDSYFESFPGNVPKPSDVRHIDCTVRVVETLLVIALWFFPAHRRYIEYSGTIFAIAGSIVRSWRISVGAKTPISNPMDWYNLVSGAITGTCKLLLIFMAVPNVDLTPLDPFHAVMQVGSCLSTYERQGLLLALLRRPTRS